MKKLVIVGLVWFVAVFLPFISCAAISGVQIALSPSIRNPLESLCEQFSNQTKYPCRIISAPTGHLYTHVMHGASYDLLISSDEVYSQALINAGKVEREGRFILAMGQIVLWSSDMTLTKEQLRKKLFDNNTRVAMANPNTTPYGVAARQTLQAHHLWQTMQTRIVFGRDLAHTYELIKDNQAVMGFISRTQLPEVAFKKDLFWEPELNDYQPVRHEILVLKSAVDNKVAQAFIEYIRSKEACVVLAKAGYQC